MYFKKISTTEDIKELEKNFKKIFFKKEKESFILLDPELVSLENKKNKKIILINNIIFLI